VSGGADGQPPRRAGQGRARLRAALPYLVTAALFAAGLAALYLLLAELDLREVAEQVRATPWGTLALAIAATALAYLSLAGYDWSALRYIGRPLPLPVVLTGGLMAYAFGNTIGLSPVSGGAVRWRIYGALGLDGYDVAAVSTFAAVAFGVAATLVGLAGLAWQPQALAAVLPMPPDLVRAGALALIAAIVLPLVRASARGAALRLWRVTVRAPSLPVLGGQVLFSMGDIGFSALTLYLLLPATGLDFPTFLAIFAAATMAGIVSHVPGGVGVFETVVIAAMPAGTPVAQVAAALLMFRLIYYLLPFVLALAVLGLYEAARATGFARLRPGGPLARLFAAAGPVFRAVEPLVPVLLAAMILGSGLWMTFAALVPPTSDAAEAFEALFPLAFVEGGALLSSALGAGLIVLALGVARRSRGAFLLALGAIAAGIVVALAQGFDLARALVLMAVLVLLWPFRRGFLGRTHLTHAALTPGWIVLVGSTLVAFGFLLFIAARSAEHAHELWWQFAADARAPRALRAALVASLAVGVLALALLLRTPRLAPQPPSDDEIARAAEILAREGRPEGAPALAGGRTLVFSDDGAAVLAFAPAGRSWVAFGAPAGPPEAAEAVATAFVDGARRAGARPVFHDIGAVDQGLMVGLGFGLVPIGEEAVITARDHGPGAPGAAALARRVAEGRAVGLTVALAEPPHEAARLEALRRLAEAAGGAAGGRLRPGWLGRWPVALLSREGAPAGFAVLPVAGGAGGAQRVAAIDLVRVVPGLPPEALPALFAAAAAALLAAGAAEVRLGTVPPERIDPLRSRRLWSRFGAALYRHGEAFPDFAALRAAKARLAPVWRPRWLAVPPGQNPLQALADVAEAVGAARRPAARPAAPAAEG
jgi:phosphatidylglycerol lysyltransferase